MRFCATAPTPSSESGRGTRWLPSAALRPARQQRHAWQHATPRQTTKFAPRQSCRNQAGLVFRPAGFFTTFFSGAAMKRSCNSFPTRQGGFCLPGTGSAFTASTDVVPISSTDTALEVRTLTSSPSQGQSSGGVLWRAVYAPGDGQTSPSYFTQPVQYLYLNCL
jgi:hypothetical protein